MFTRILVPTDFSDASDAALVYGRALTRKFGASLHVLHVYEDPLLVQAVTAEAYVPETPEMRVSLMKEAQERLQYLTHPSDESQPRATGEVVVGSPARAIIDYADGNGVNLIVMGTHGRGGMAHLLLGSVAERVVRTAFCPVLTVRQAAELSELSEAAVEPSPV